MAAATGRPYRRRLLLWGGTVGFGLGAIVDVIVFHLVFQHHHLLSGYFDPSSYEGLRTNVLYDGLFLALMLGITLLGSIMLWRTINGTRIELSGTSLIGATVVGAGVFNLFDGVLTHYVLGFHDVVHASEAWNPHWIGISLLMLGVGVTVLRIGEN